MIRRPPSYQSVPARFIATAGGAGYFPWAPGTCGTAVAALLAAALAPLPTWAFVTATAATIVAGIWAASVCDRLWQTQDSGRIVIDEVAGYFVTVSFADRGALSVLAVGFVLFRFFDIVKPPPVGWLERNLVGGLGVVLDDVAAGVLAGLLLFALAQTPLLSRLEALL